MTFFSLIVAIALLGRGACSQAGADISVETISPQQAQEMINHMEGQRARRDFALKVLDSKRAELIEACFQNQYTMGWILDGVRNMPPSRFKDEMVVLMLNSTSPFWPPDGFVPQGSQSIGPKPGEPFASVAKAYFPSRLFDVTTLKDSKARSNLAREIESAMKSKADSGFSSPLPVPPPHQAALLKTPPAAISDTSVNSKRDGHDVAPDAKTNPGKPTYILWVCILVLLATASIWVVVKRKSK